MDDLGDVLLAILWLSLPSSLEVIEAGTFRSCGKLENVTLQGEIKEIGEIAFRNCHRLRTIDIPSTVKVIHLGAFEGCFRLQEVNVPNGCKIGRVAFPPTCKITYYDPAENGADRPSVKKDDGLEL